MNTKTILKRPADLDPTKLHSPAEVRAHRAAIQAYFDTVRAEADHLHRREEVAKAEANKMLDEDEYFALAKQREAEKQAREAARAAERHAAAAAKADYLASSPSVAEISENNPHTFLTTVIHWASRGYSMSDDADIAFIAPSYYAVKLNAPEPALEAPAPQTGKAAKK